MNVFHWHLTDDQGWRIEIKKYPRLTDLGAWRTHETWKEWWAQRPRATEETKGNEWFTPAFSDAQNGFGGFYTQDDIREVVEHPGGVGIVPVDADGYADDTYKEYIEPIGELAMMKNYAQLRAGDMIGNTITAGGHCRIVVEDPVVMLDEEGNLDPEVSYVTTCEQAGFLDFEENGLSFTSSTRVDTKYSFAELIKDGYVPMTCKCLVTSTEDVSEATVEDTLDGRLGLTTGTVVATRNLDSVEMVITDADGNEIFRNRMFTTVGKTTDSNSEYFVIRKVPKTYDLANFTPAISQIQWDLSKTYHCTITAFLNCGDEVVAREFDF